MPEMVGLAFARDSGAVRRDGTRERNRVAHAVRRGVDACLAAVLVFVMATPLAEEAAHEWLGIATAALSVLHVVLNARLFRARARTGFAGTRALFVAIDAALAVCLVALVASSLVLSVHAFSWLPAFSGASWARPVHMACSFWLFALSAFHVGMHVRLPLRRGARDVLPSGVGVLRAPLAGALAVAAALGALAFAWLDLGSYLLLQVPFYAVDTSQPLALRAVAYAFSGALFAAIGCAVNHAVSRMGRVSKKTGLKTKGRK